MFNENLKPDLTSERNARLFKAGGSISYDIGFTGLVPSSATSLFSFKLTDVFLHHIESLTLSFFQYCTKYELLSGSRLLYTLCIDTFIDPPPDSLDRWFLSDESSSITVVSHGFPVKPPLAEDCRTLQLHRRPTTSQLQHNEKSFSLKTVADGQVLLHSNSVNSRALRIPFPWLVFNEKISIIKRRYRWALENVGRILGVLHGTFIG
ncbi:unnamed protein product [Lactuca saligna]|uniref:Uncharacterized protein n=1 Tax=Lactuca saligna TaxID=75948 RepID=A0AA35ZA06_LACSI|nr:unnamed protein product [Lactuca saligna]